MPTEVKEKFEGFAEKCRHRATLYSFRAKEPRQGERRVCGSWLNRGNLCCVSGCKEFKR